MILKLKWNTKSETATQERWVKYKTNLQLWSYGIDSKKQISTGFKKRN
jgi:hypothetical protein